MKRETLKKFQVSSFKFQEIYGKQNSSDKF